jgi:3-dehydroquinate synthase
MPRKTPPTARAGKAEGGAARLAGRHRSNIRVPLRRTIDESYDIEIGEDLFEQVPRDLRANILARASRIAIITDGVVRLLYGEKLLSRLRGEGIDAAIFDFAPGERHKTRETKAALEDALIAARFGRDSGIIALGGGVVSDLAGFVAGTFARGVPFVVYSTTLLGAADASVGGKTAVDTPVATNLIGLFHQPRKVYIDTATWGTLPPTEFRNGLAETVKHACLGDRGFFEYLEQHIDQLLSAVANGGAIDPAVAAHIAANNCEIKSRIVAADVHETNLRQVLNLGHTLGRALEPLADFSLSHGEAVAIGLVFQLRLGKRRYEQRKIADNAAHVGKFSREGCTDNQRGLPIPVPPFCDKLGDVLIELAAASDREVLQIRAARVGRAAKHDDATIGVAEKRLDGVETHVGIHSDRVGTVALERLPRVMGGGRADVATFSIQDDREVRVVGVDVLDQSFQLRFGRCAREIGNLWLESTDHICGGIDDSFAEFEDRARLAPQVRGQAADIGVEADTEQGVVARPSVLKVFYEGHLW